MQGKSIRDGAIGIEYTSKRLSGWGGLALWFEFVEREGFFETLESALPCTKTSPNQVRDLDVVKSLFATVLTGGNRFAHVERLRGDEVVAALGGIERMASADTVRRLFERFTQSESETMYAELQRALGSMLAKHTIEDVLDLDSTILERYGNQQGVAKGYHASRANQRSHHPLLGMLAKARYIVHAWLRAGGASTLRGGVEFIDELLERLPPNFKITAVRADAGFFNESYLQAFEAKQLDYIIAVRMHPPMKKAAAQIRADQWKRLDEAYEVAEVMHQGVNWSRPRRVIFARRTIGHPGSLFDTVSYEYSALVTTLSMPAELCCAFYDQRGTCENTIKEFKNDFGARGFCSNSFTATETVFRLISVLFNLVSEFKRHVLVDLSVTLATMRTKIFVVGAMLGRRARRLILRLGLTESRKENFQTLFDRLSTAAQFTPNT